MNIKLLTEHHLEFLSSKGGCTGLSESTLVKMPHFWKSDVMAHNIESSTYLNQPVFALFVFYILILRLKIHQILYSLETSAFEELGSEFINFASNCVINTLRLFVYLTGLSI